jgi:DNA-binding NtrC family response regulator
VRFHLLACALSFDHSNYRVYISNMSEKIQIIAVDDEGDARILYKHFFKSEVQRGEVELSFLTSPQECLDLLQNLKGKIIVLSDINMPGMSGFELLKEIKSNYPEVKVMMVSAYDIQDYVEKASQLGALDYIHKPVDFDKLKQSIFDLF